MQMKIVLNLNKIHCFKIHNTFYYSYRFIPLLIFLSIPKHQSYFIQFIFFIFTMNEMKEDGSSIDFTQKLENIKAEDYNIPEIAETESENQSEYFVIMKNILCESRLQLEKKMMKQIVWNQKKFRASFEKVTQYKYGNSYIFYASLGHFETSISLLKINMSSQFLLRQTSSLGGYSSIYIQYFENTSYVIKSQKIPEQSIANFDQKFDKILQEFMICQIASIFQFGPKLKKLYYFDIICFSDSMQFSMQLCRAESGSFHLQREKLELNLLAGMKIMHSLQIVHRDIKPSNISWSPSSKKWVFLDFGFSNSIQEKPGKKTLAFYCGTYKYVSAQLKNLYHLKQPKLVDLYANDLYGLKTSCLDFFLHNLDMPMNRSSDFFPLLCRMKYCIWNELMEEAFYIFVKHVSLREEFLKLLRIELERAEQMKIKDSQQYLLYKKFNQINQDKFQPNSIDNEIQQLEKEQRKKYFQLFIKEEQKFKPIFMLEKQQKLRKIIIQKRNSLSFIKEIFSFFQETLSSNKENAWNRLILITDIMLEIFGFKFKQNNWIWKFHDLLIIFQQKFTEQNQYFLLKQIQDLYQIFNDQGRFRKLKSLRLQKASEYEKIIYQIYEFYCQIAIFTQLDFSRKKFWKLKQKIIQSEYKDLQILFVTLRVAELMLSSRLLSIDEKQQFRMLIQLLNLNQKQSIQSIISYDIIFQIYIWMTSPFQRNCFQMQNKQSCNFLLSSFYDEFKHIFDIVGKLGSYSKKKQKKITIVPSFLELYPLLKEIPHIFTIQMYFCCRNPEKINQIALNLFLFNQDCLQYICKELNVLQSRWYDLSQQIKQAQFFLKYFIASYQQKLTVESLQSYWNLYQCFYCCGRQLFNNNDKLKKQFISSLQQIINFFYQQDLSLRCRIIINLFMHLKMYHEGKGLKTHQFLNKFPQVLQIEEEKKKNIYLIIQFFSKHEVIQEKYFLQNTSLFNHLKAINSLPFYFDAVEDFFQVTLLGKVLEKKQQEALSLIVEHTKYLTPMNIFKKEFHILQKFVNLNSHNKMQMLMYFLKADFRIINENNYLSSLILLIYLKHEKQFLINLKFKEILRVYRLSVINIKKLGIPRIQLQKKLKYKFRQFEQGIKPRKKKILNYQEDYARGQTFFLERDFERGIGNKQKYYGKFKIYFERKKTKLEQNLKIKVSLVLPSCKLVSDLLQNN